MGNLYSKACNIVRHLKILLPERGVECTRRFPCVSYEATKRGQVPLAARVRCRTTPVSCVTSTVALERPR